MLFLGTAGAVPTARRAPSATLVRRGGERILVDCAEGTQRQLLRSVAGLSDVDLVLLTHHHADHVLGLPGMMKTFALRDREQPLVIAGPRGLSALMTGFAPVIGRLTYEVEVRELEPGERDRARRLPGRALRHPPRRAQPGLRAMRGAPARAGSTWTPPAQQACPTVRCSGSCRRASG